MTSNRRKYKKIENNSYNDSEIKLLESNNDERIQLLLPIINRRVKNSLDREYKLIETRLPVLPISKYFLRDNISQEEILFIENDYKIHGNITRLRMQHIPKDDKTITQYYYI